MSSNKSKKSKQQQSEDLLPVAFDIEEKIDLPEGYILDQEYIESINFLKSTKIEEKKFISRVRNTREVEYNLNVNNNQSYLDIYKNLGINNGWVNQIKQEYNSLTNYINSHRAELKVKMSVDQITSKFKIFKENPGIMLIPSEEDVVELSKNINNKLCISLIKVLTNIYPAVKNSDQEYRICLWIYYVLHMILLPLIDEDNSVLYKLVKVIYSKPIETTFAKIIFVLLSEIFSQKIVL
jgi:hypothetical protein